MRGRVVKILASAACPTNQALCPVYQEHQDDDCAKHAADDNKRYADRALGWIPRRKSNHDNDDKVGEDLTKGFAQMLFPDRAKLAR
jgi:hypothetical protein